MPNLNHANKALPADLVGAVPDEAVPPGGDPEDLTIGSAPVVDSGAERRAHAIRGPPLEAVLDRLMRKDELERTVGLTERQVRRLELAGRFPKRILIDPKGRSVGWSAKEVASWMAARMAARETQAA